MPGRYVTVAGAPVRGQSWEVRAALRVLPQ